MVCYICLCADAIDVVRNQSSGRWWDDFLCAEVKLPTKVGSFTASVADSTTLELAGVRTSLNVSTRWDKGSNGRRLRRRKINK